MSSQFASACCEYSSLKREAEQSQGKNRHTPASGSQVREGDPILDAVAVIPRTCAVGDHRVSLLVCPRSWGEYRFWSGPLKDLPLNFEGGEK